MDGIQNQKYTNGAEALYPLHRVEIDHVLLDIDVKHEETGLLLGRPCFTLGIDLYSRMVWSMHLSLQPPSIDTLRKAIEHGVSAKSTKVNFGTNNEWEVSGVPEIISVDNGAEFRNTKLSQTIGNVLGSSVQHRALTIPQYGRAIDHLFGVLSNEFLQRLVGTEGSCDLVPTLDELRGALVKYITDVYSYQRHVSLPDDCPTPLLRYWNGVERFGAPKHIPPEQEATTKIALLPTVTRAYTRNGIRLNNVLYRLDSTTDLRESCGFKYMVQYNPEDISKIYVQLPDSEGFVEVPAVVPPATDLHMLNLSAWKQICQVPRERGAVRSDYPNNVVQGRENE